jgi:hypothetical protein
MRFALLKPRQKIAVKEGVRCGARDSALKSALIRAVTMVTWPFFSGIEE